MQIIFKLAPIILFAILPISLLASDPIYTYGGIYTQGGFEKIKYNNWNGSDVQNYSSSGNFYSTGVFLLLSTAILTGEFSAGYMLNITDTAATKIHHCDFSSKLKYRYNIKPGIDICPGVGLYLQSPPATKKFDGAAGGMLILGSMYDIGANLKIIADIFCSYGSFGAGHDTEKYAFGINLGVVTKLGHF